MPILTINNQPIEVNEEVTLLGAIEKTGVKVPTLCHHKALTPYGSCRLCVVEIHRPDRAPFLQASCSYPALDGLSVFTDTDRVRRARKIAAELLLARCPDSAAIQRIAHEYGVVEPRIKKKYDDCFYCGLCVRMCEERMGRSAIGFTGRGPHKQLESPFRKHNEMCWTCGACDFICPARKKVTDLTTGKEFIPLPNTYNLGLDRRPAAYVLYPQAVPNKATLDPEACIRLTHDACGICEVVCEAKAIDFKQKDRIIEIEAGAIILSPGFEAFDATVKEGLGYGRYRNVISSIQFERMLSPSGPDSGSVLRPSDHSHPKRLAFIQCVGSRELDRDYCSSVCCMYATKQAIIAKEHAGSDLQCDIYFMDIRAFSKGFEQYYESAKKKGVQYIRCRVPLIEEIPGTQNLMVKYLGEVDQRMQQEYELVILSVGLDPPKDVLGIARTFGIELNELKFCRTSIAQPAESTRPGVFVAGPFTEPKDIPETVMQGSAAASRVLSMLRDVRGSLIKPLVYPPEIDVTGQEPRIGVFVCYCGTNIGGVVNVPEVVEYAKSLPDVAYAEANLYTCSNDTQERIKEKIKENHLNRVVVASCTPRTHEPLFKNTMREGGLNPYLFEMANIRDQCSWVHMLEPNKATIKSKDLLRMALAKSRLLEPLQMGSLAIRKAALVIGGGLAGMTSALEMANQGFDVFLVEKQAELGGNLRRIRHLFDGEDPAKMLETIIAQVTAHPRIRIFTAAKIERMEGSIGKYKTKISTHGTVEEVEHGVVVIASGAKEYVPREYLYGQDERVITQRELEDKIAASGKRLFAGNGNKPATVVMIQCVGSRDEERPSCSRICCSEAVKNALKIKECSPEAAVYVLYRDVRTYGFKEKYYTQARQKGVAFIRWDKEAGPEVVKDTRGLNVRVFDRILKIHVEIPADLVVLSTGVVANDDNKTIAQFVKVPLNQEGFFLEAHMKLRPVDFATDGVFLCGLAHSPKLIDESVIQAQAVAARAATILSKDRIELDANISWVIDENCDGCAYCVDPCPYKAITLLEYMWQGFTKKIVEVNESLCHGCGTCMATCPKRGVFIRSFTLDQIQAQLDSALQGA